MATGTVKWFSDDKGFGFITPDEGSRPVRALLGDRRDGYRSLAEGTRVSYEEEQGDKGPKAVNVQKLAARLARHRVAVGVAGVAVRDPRRAGRDRDRAEPGAARCRFARRGTDDEAARELGRPRQVARRPGSAAARGRPRRPPRGRSSRRRRTPGSRARSGWR